MPCSLCPFRPLPSLVFARAPRRQRQRRVVGCSQDSIRDPYARCQQCRPHPRTSRAHQSDRSPPTPSSSRLDLPRAAVGAHAAGGTLEAAAGRSRLSPLCHHRPPPGHPSAPATSASTRPTEVISMSARPPPSVLVLISPARVFASASFAAHRGVRSDSISDVSAKKTRIKFKQARAEMDRGEDVVPTRPKIPKLHIANLKSQQTRKRGNRNGSASVGLQGDDNGKSQGSKGRNIAKGRVGRHQKDTSGIAKSDDAAKDARLTGGMSQDDTTVSDVDEHELDAEELRLQAEKCFALERGIFLLAKRTEEVRARKEASKALEAFQVELRAELEDMMQSMEQEKRTKLKEADVFKRCALR